MTCESSSLSMGVGEVPEQVHARGEHRHAAFLLLIKVAEQVEHAGPVPKPRGDAG